MEAAGLHEAIAYHQLPPAKLIFLQPELHNEDHACMRLHNFVIEGPGDETGGGRQERAGDGGGGEGGGSSQR